MKQLGFYWKKRQKIWQPLEIGERSLFLLLKTS
jgi:hypothetical protein